MIMAQNDEASQTLTREQRRKEKEEKSSSSHEENKKTRKKGRERLIPIWARLLIILVLLILSVIAGLITGYGIVGEGDTFQILKWETWSRFLEFINGE